MNTDKNTETNPQNSATQRVRDRLLRMVRQFFAMIGYVPKEDLNFSRKLLKKSCDEWAEDDALIEDLCRLNGVDEFEITGDSYGVPCIQSKTGSLVKKLGGNVPRDFEFFS